MLDKSQGVFVLDDAILTEVEVLGKEINSAQEAAVHDFQSYIEERTRIDGRQDRRGELFDYAGLRAAGVPIGSGATEATVKSLVSVRMKRCGHRWSVPGATATLACRAFMLSSDTWDVVWPAFAESYLADVIPLKRSGEVHRARPERHAA